MGHSKSTGSWIGLERRLRKESCVLDPNLLLILGLASLVLHPEPGPYPGHRSWPWVWLPSGSQAKRVAWGEARQRHTEYPCGWARTSLLQLSFLLLIVKQRAWPIQILPPGRSRRLVFIFVSGSIACLLQFALASCPHCQLNPGVMLHSGSGARAGG